MAARQRHIRSMPCILARLQRLFMYGVRRTRSLRWRFIQLRLASVPGQDLPCFAVDAFLLQTRRVESPGGSQVPVVRCVTTT